MIEILLVAGLLAQTPHVDSPEAPAPVVEPPPFAPVHAQGRTWHFDDADAVPVNLKDWPSELSGDAKKRMGAPRIEDGKLYLLESWANSSAVIAIPYDESLEGVNAGVGFVPSTVVIGWTVVMNTGTEGMGFAWIDADHIPSPTTTKDASDGADAATTPFLPVPMKPDESKDPWGNAMLERPVWGWEAPNLRHAFGLGLDASNPVNRDPFKGSGNAMDRPQHEISLHWDGLEIIKKTTATEFRDEKPHAIRATIEFVTGGADVTLTLDDETVFDRYFIPGMVAFSGRGFFGARNAETAGDVLLDDLSIVESNLVTRPTPPTRIVALDHVLNDKEHTTNTSVVDLPQSLDGVGRIIATLRLDKPESRFDPWDRIAHISIENEDGTDRTEMIRYITPYHRGYEWSVDVSDLRPLLMGRKRFVQECTTYGEGWIVSLNLEYYPGPAPENLIATSVINLWCGNPTIGDPDHPPSEFYTPKEIAIPRDTVAAKVRLVVSGHGMSPNTGNAAEFMSIGRTLKANGHAFTNTLWKTDNYLNPCRPQGGTWKYDRAGWAPGDVVRPWIVDVTDALAADRPLNLEYILDDYVNDARGKTNAPTHTTESQLILYRKASHADATTTTPAESTAP
ncbi:MAG: hypothetical protein IPK69_01195 [Phycisphaerales bacterium]|nr:MAG: hypothetical protein IPK69_01195 [Phycisphaerales bacterium]